jgi:hypothetical protein
MKQRLTCYWGLILTAVAVAPCSAALFLVTLPAPGTGAPPATLGGYTMYAFPPDARAESSMVSTVPFWNGDSLGLATTPAYLNDIGGAWATWSHGYSGPVYWTDSMDAEQQMLMFPANIKAFYMYIQPNFRGDSFDFTFTAGGQTTKLTISGDGGAQYVGVYADGINEYLDSLLIMDLSQGDSEGFAIGEFASDVPPPVNVIPEPGSMVALGCVLAAGLLRRNRIVA